VHSLNRFKLLNLFRKDGIIGGIVELSLHLAKQNDAKQAIIIVAMRRNKCAAHNEGFRLGHQVQHCCRSA
jgi:hypothetical protein